MYDSNHQPSDNITCILDPETKKWLTPLCLSTSDDSVGGMDGNDLISAKVDTGVWRCIGKNPNEQFWYPRDLFTTPVPVAEFTLTAASDWADECVTLELDQNFTKFTLTADNTVPAARNYTVPCNYSMMLTIKNANAGNVTPPQDNNDEVTPPPQDNDGEATPQPQDDNSGDINIADPSLSQIVDQEEKADQLLKEKEEQERKEKEEQERKEKEERERKEKEEREKRRKIEELNDFVNHFPVFSVDDGFDTPPKIQQNANESGAWVRGFRESKKGAWFMIDENVNNQYIYPGNIILVDKDKRFTQNMVPIPFEASERKPLRLDARYSSEIPNGSTTLNSFTRADVNNFVSQCLTTFKNSSHDLASNTNWQYESSQRSEGITLGGTIKGIKFSGSAFERNKTVVIAYLRQEMYTISVNNEYSYASDLFTDKVDAEKFRRNVSINVDNVAAPAIIDAVKYGRIISLWVVQEGNEPAKLNVDDYFNLTVNNTNKTTKYYLRVFGGIAGSQSTDTDSLEKAQNVLKQFKEVNKNAMETAMPIEYSVRFLRNLTTNVEWKVLPYFKTYLPRVKFSVTEKNTGASMKCAVYMLNYQPHGNQLEYVKTEVDKKGVDYDCYPSPKALCIDIKIDVTCATDPYDFNIMLPCIPYDRLEPDKNGDWVFQVNISGRKVGDKQAQCTPSLPGAILSTSNQIYMNNPKILDGPLVKFGKGTDYSEDRILNYYIAWAKAMVRNDKRLRFLYSIDNIRQLRPDYD